MLSDNPGSLLNLFFFHWLKILYAFEIFLIVGSILLGAAEPVRDFAWRAFGLTLTLNVVVLLLGDYIRGRRRWWRLLVVLVAIAVLFFTGAAWAALVSVSWTFCVAWPVSLTTSPSTRASGIGR